LGDVSVDANRMNVVRQSAGKGVYLIWGTPNTKAVTYILGSQSKIEGNRPPPTKTVAYIFKRV
jgi:hypothetical protein